MQKFVCLFVIFCVATNVTSSLVLDSYTEYGLVLNIVPTNIGYSFENGTSILGGERDMILQTSGRANTIFSSGCSGEVYTTASPSGGSGTATIQYDGYDHSPQLNPNGLGGIDLTANGMSAVEFYANTDVNVEFYIYIYSGSNSSYCLSSFALTPQNSYYRIPYNSFSYANGGCKFNYVGAVVTVISFNGNVDVSIEPISFTMEDSPSPSSTVTPSNTFSALSSYSRTRTATRSPSHTRTGTPTPSQTPSMYSTHSPTPTRTRTSSATPTRTPTPTVTPGRPSATPSHDAHGTKVIEIDGFYDPAPNMVIDIPANAQFPISLSTVSNGTNIIGYERDMELYALSGYQYDEFIVYIHNVFLNGEFPYYGSGKLLLQYDGTDHSLNLSPNGLTFDGTSGGANSFYFEFYGDNPMNITILVYSGTSSAYCTSTIPTARGDSAYVAFYNNFYNYGCSFSDIGAIEMEIIDNNGYVNYFSLTSFYTYAYHSKSSQKNLQWEL